MAIENGTGDFVIDVDLALRDLNSQKLIGEINRKANQADAAFSRLGEGLRKGDKYLSSLAAGAHRLTADLTKAGRETITLEQAMREVGSAVSSIDQGLKNLQSEIVKSKTLQRQAIISQRAEQDRARQAELEATRSANAKLNIEAQRAAQSQVIAQRQAGQQRIQLTRAVIENIGRLEKGLGAVIAGTARTATGAAGRVFDSLTAKIRNTNRVFTEGTSTALSRREQLIRGSFSRQERLLSETVSRQSRTIQQLNRQVSGGVLGGVTGRGAGAGLGGVAGGVGIASLLTSGFQRFSDLERINKQFLALTGSLEDTELLLGQVKEFAKTTPFNLVGVADLAKGFLAIGTATEDVIPRVTAIADAVAFTGGGVDELNRIQRAIGQVVSAGRLQGDELNQLAENLPALNIRQILADQLTGGNVAQLVEMQEAGEITSDLFVTGLITGLQQDERLVGASQDLADTLSGRVANLKESFADFGASIIGVIAEPLKAATTIAQNALQGLADFVKGEVGPALGVLRTFLGGVAKGFAAVVAAKGAIEVISLVGRVAALAATPFGALVVAAGLIGGTLSVLAKNFPQVGEALRGLADTVRRLVSGPFGRLKELFSGVLDFFVSDRSKVVAGIGEFGAEVNNRFIQAADATSGFQDFITNKLLPTLRTFVSFAQERVLPVLASFGRTIVGAFSTAKEVVVEFVSDALPRLQTLAGKVGDIGKSISEAVGRSRLVAAAGAGIAGFAVAGPIGGIVAAFASLADKIIPALKPVGERILEFFRGLFTKANLIDVGKGALQVVETIGFAIGNIVSDPKFITALAAVAAAAALVALRFAEGVAKGLWENVPELASIALRGALKGLSTIVSEVLFDPQVLALAVTAALIAPKLIGAFKSFGEQGAKGFARGFTSGVRVKGDFLTGLFGGADRVQMTASRKFWQETDQQVRALQLSLRAFGSETQVAFNPASIKAANKELANMTRGLSEAQIQGVIARQSFTDTFAALRSGVSGVAGGLSTIGSAFGDVGRRISNGLQRGVNALAEFGAFGGRNQGIFKDVGIKAGDGVTVGFREQLRRGAGQIGQAFTGTISELRSIATANGTTVGRLLGGKIASGLAIGLGAFVAGRAEGQAGGSGALSAIGAGLTGLAVGGPIVGAAAAGISFVGTMFGKAAKKAADMKQRVADLAGTLKGELANGLKVGADGLASLVESLDAAGFATKVGDSLKSVQGDLLDLGITLEDVLSGFKAGDGGVEALGARVLGSDADLETKMKLLAALDRSYGDVRQAVEDFNTERTFTGEAARDRSLSAEAARLEALAARYGEVVPAAGELNTIFGEEVQPRFTEAMNAALDAAKLKADEVSQAIDRIFGNRDPEGLAASLDAAIVNVAGSFQGLTTEGGIIDQANLNRALDNLRVQLSDATKAGINEGAIYDEQTLRTQTLSILGAALDGVENQSLRDAIAQTYEDGVANALPTLNTQNIFDQLAAGLSEEEVVVPATLDNRALSAEAARLAAQAKQYGTTAGANYGDGLDSGIRQKVEKARRAAAAIAAAVQDTVNNWWDINSPSKVAMEQGGFYTEGLAIGIGANSAMAAQAAQQAAMSTINSFGGTSVLASAQDAGLTIGQAIANGLADAEADMTSVVSNAVEALLKQISTLGSASKDAATNAAALLFGGITGSDRVGLGGIGAGTTGAGVGAITGSLGSFLSTFDSNVSRIFEVNAKKLGDLTAADREVYGTNVFSLDPNSVFGASNLSAITDFLDNVASLGESLIAQGQPLDQVRTTLEGYIDDLITTASNLGFNRDQLLGLIDQLGLSDAALAEFIRQVDALNAAAAGGPTSAATPSGLLGNGVDSTDTVVDPTTLPQVVQYFDVHLPTGDPYAAALTIANRQAAAATLPGT